MLVIIFIKLDHLSLLASLSHSIKAKTSPNLTGPFTFLIKVLLSDPKVSTFTYVMAPLDPFLNNYLFIN